MNDLLYAYRHVLYRCIVQVVWNLARATGRTFRYRQHNQVCFILLVGWIIRHQGKEAKRASERASFLARHPNRNLNAHRMHTYMSLRHIKDTILGINSEPAHPDSPTLRVRGLFRSPTIKIGSPSSELASQIASYTSRSKGNLWMRMHAPARSNRRRQFGSNKKRHRITIDHDRSTCWSRNLPVLGRRIVSERWRSNEGVEVGDMIDFWIRRSRRRRSGWSHAWMHGTSQSLSGVGCRDPIALCPLPWRDLRFNVSSYTLSLHFLKTHSTSVATWVPAVA
jgi:hypothetical protein